MSFFLFFSELVDIFLFHQPLLCLKSDCNKFTQIAPFERSLSLDVIARSKVGFIQYRWIQGWKFFLASTKAVLFCFGFQVEMWKLTTLMSTSESSINTFYVSASSLHVCVRRNSLRHCVWEHRKLCPKELLANVTQPKSCLLSLWQHFWKLRMFINWICLYQQREFVLFFLYFFFFSFLKPLG